MLRNKIIFNINYCVYLKLLYFVLLFARYSNSIKRTIIFNILNRVFHLLLFLIEFCFKYNKNMWQKSNHFRSRKLVFLNNCNCLFPLNIPPLFDDNYMTISSFLSSILKYWKLVNNKIKFLQFSFFKLRLC